MSAERSTIHLLLVEDNPDDVFLFRASLKKFTDADITVVDVSRVREAIAMMTSRSFDLVVTDLNVPDSVGIETVRKLITKADGVPVIALTGWDDPLLGAQLVEEGVRCYWSKDRLSGIDLAQAIVAAARGGNRIQIHNRQD